MPIIDDENIRSELRRAWHESQPDSDDVHEEGGFILGAERGQLAVERWPRGSRNRLRVPAFAEGVWNGLSIVATFHTHPNSGPRFIQEPSPTDIEAVRDDPDLKKPWYEGEYVISRSFVYRILPNGKIETVGITAELLGT